jgi:hypothetical protein
MKKKIFVSRSVVDYNENNGEDNPVFIIIKSDGTEYKSSNMLILGSCELKYDRKAEQGMRVWIETMGRIIVNNGTDSEIDCIW